MKRFFIKYMVAVLLIMVAAKAIAQPKAVQDSLAKANTLYATGEYDKAAQLYEAILLKGFESKELYYNLGNACYKSNQITKSIINYERALKLSPKDEDALYNLAIAKKMIVDNIETLPEPGFLRWWKDMIAALTTDQWATRSVVAFLFFLGLFALFLFTTKAGIKKLSFWFSLLFLVYSIFTFSFASSQKSRLTGSDKAVITERSLRVKGSPSETGTELFIIHEGLTVQITDQLGEWIEIRIADGNKGWVKENSMVKI